MPDDVFILDTGHTVYVWVGDDARPEEKTMAIDTGLVRTAARARCIDADPCQNSRQTGSTQTQLVWLFKRPMMRTQSYRHIPHSNCLEKKVWSGLEG